MREEIFLNDVWAVYFHDPNDHNWTTQSYHRLGDISTVNDFWDHLSSIKDNVHKGMFFIMREHIFPCWDDPCNIKGGCLSIKVLKDDMILFWEDVCMKLMGETIIKDEFRNLHWDKVNGISTSPKKHFCIIKIWLACSEAADKIMYDIRKVYHGDMIYKSNQENISNDQHK